MDITKVISYKTLNIPKVNIIHVQKNEYEERYKTGFVVKKLRYLTLSITYVT